MSYEMRKLTVIGIRQMDLWTNDSHTMGKRTTNSLTTNYYSLTPFNSSTFNILHFYFQVYLLAYFVHTLKYYLKYIVINIYTCLIY